MIKRVVIFIFLFIVSIQSYSQITWNKYVNDDPQFTISFPGKIEFKQKDITTDLGQSTVHTLYSVSEIDSTDNYFYLLSYYY
ncbi:MAG: hypothetical protein R2771_07580 [Saprospiraceae bacterium]